MYLQTLKYYFYRTRQKLHYVYGLTRKNLLGNNIANTNNLTTVQCFIKCCLGKLLCSVTANKAAWDIANIGGDVVTCICLEVWMCHKRGALTFRSIHPGSFLRGQHTNGLRLERGALAWQTLSHISNQQIIRTVNVREVAGDDGSGGVRHAPNAAKLVAGSCLVCP